MGGINTQYGVSSRGGAQRWKSHTFFSGSGVITEGDGEGTLISGNIPAAQVGNTFLIKIAIFGDNNNTTTLPNLVFRLVVDGFEIARDNLAAPAMDFATTWYRGFVEEAPATTGSIELFWEYTATALGAQQNVSRVTMLIEEVSA